MRRRGDIALSKVKYAECHGCGKPINRHDGKRITLVHSITRAKVTYHLKCYQETGH